MSSTVRLDSGSSMYTNICVYVCIHISFRKITNTVHLSNIGDNITYICGRSSTEQVCENLYKKKKEMKQRFQHPQVTRRSQERPNVSDSLYTTHMHTRTCACTHAHTHAPRAVSTHACTQANNMQMAHLHIPRMSACLWVYDTSTYPVCGGVPFVYLCVYGCMTPPHTPYVEVCHLYICVFMGV